MICTIRNAQCSDFFFFFFLQSERGQRFVFACLFFHVTLASGPLGLGSFGGHAPTDWPAIAVIQTDQSTVTVTRWRSPSAPWWMSCWDHISSAFIKLIQSVITRWSYPVFLIDVWMTFSGTHGGDPSLTGFRLVQYLLATAGSRHWARLQSLQLSQTFSFRTRESNY